MTASPRFGMFVWSKKRDNLTVECCLPTAPSLIRLALQFTLQAKTDQSRCSVPLLARKRESSRVMKTQCLTSHSTHREKATCYQPPQIAPSASGSEQRTTLQQTNKANLLRACNTHYEQQLHMQMQIVLKNLERRKMPYSTKNLNLAIINYILVFCNASISDFDK